MFPLSWGSDSRRLSIHQGETPCSGLLRSMWRLDNFFASQVRFSQISRARWSTSRLSHSRPRHLLLDAGQRGSGSIRLGFPLGHVSIMASIPNAFSSIWYRKRVRISHPSLDCSCKTTAIVSQYVHNIPWSCGLFLPTGCSCPSGNTVRK